MDTSVRWSGLCLVASGLLTVPVVAHPNIFRKGFAEASQSWFWTPGHTAGLAVAALSLLGLAGVSTRFGARLGRLGAVGLVLAVVGLVATAGLVAVEAFAFPLLARTDPALLDLDGPLVGSAVFRAVGGLALLWLVGEALVGVALERARVMHRGGGALLAGGALSFAAFEGPFVPVLGLLSVVLFAAAQIWFGISLGFAAATDRGVALPTTTTGERTPR